MRFLFKIILLLLISCSCFSQQNQVKVAYNFISQKEQKKMILYYNDTSSLCIYNKEGWDTNYSTFKGIYANSSKGAIIKVSQYDSIGQLIYRNFNQKEIIIRQTKVGILNSFIVKDNWLEIKWKLSAKEKKIHGYTCKKAIGYFRGRTYIAWYTPEIKQPYGPWKLFGLPGLILEAYDRNRAFSFKVTDISTIDSFKIKKPKEPEIKTLKDYVYYLDSSFRLTYEKLKSKPLPKGMSIGPIIYETPQKEVREKSIEKGYEWETKLGKNKKDKISISKD